MTPFLEIVIAAQNPGAGLAATAASLAAQTDHGFTVILSDNFSTSGLKELDAAEKQLTAAGISVWRARPPFALGRIEHWNWAHAQAQGEWLKPLPPGARLKPDYVDQLRKRVTSRPEARMIRCDAEMLTQWGWRELRAPFAGSSVTAAEFLNHFPAHVDWLGGLTTTAYRRAAWLGLGGFSVHLPACAALHLNALLALHYGLENLSGPLASAESPAHLSLNEGAGGRVNLSLELSLAMCQLRNYCLAAKLPWPKGGVRRGVWRGQDLPADPA